MDQFIRNQVDLQEKSNPQQQPEQQQIQSDPNTQPQQQQTNQAQQPENGLSQQPQNEQIQQPDINIADILSAVRQSLPSMTYSMITKRKPATESNQQTAASSHTSETFKRLVSKYFTGAKNADLLRSIAEQADKERPQKILNLGQLADIKLWIQKKGKKMGGLKTREAHLSNEDVLSFSQLKHNKKYSVPQNFLPQTRAEYNESKRGLPWISPRSKIGECNYRILYTRLPTAEEAPRKEKPKDEFDSAFYFHTEEEYMKVRNYLQCLVIESKVKDLPEIMKNISLSHRMQLIKRFRSLVGYRAKSILKRIADEKVQRVSGSRALANYDRLLVHQVIGGLYKEASLIYNKSQKASEDQIRKRRLIEALDQATVIRNYNRTLVGSFLHLWHRIAEQKHSPQNELVVFTFRSIELPVDIMKPVFVITVINEKVNNAFMESEPIAINSQRVFEDKTNFQPDLLIKSKAGASALKWKISGGLEQTSIRGTRTFSKSEQFYTLIFNSISKDQIANLRFKFAVYNESKELKAVQYYKFENLYFSSKRGHDMCLSLGTSSDSVQYLLQMKVESYHQDFIHTRKEKSVKYESSDYITDIYFNYSFSFPAITPRHSKFLSLLPESWKVLDETLKAVHRSGDLGKWVQRVKYRLIRHYHSKNARHLAQLEQNHLIWASLQEELIEWGFTKPRGKEDIFIDDVHLNELVQLSHPSRHRQEVQGEDEDEENENERNAGEDSDKEVTSLPVLEKLHWVPKKKKKSTVKQDVNREPMIVSYLFKRDRWPHVQEWLPYYDKLSELCHKGIPPQLRKVVWSELGRVCYFVELTDMYLSSLGHREQDHHPQYDDVGSKNRAVYEEIKNLSKKDFYYLFQELEEDINTLRIKQGKDKLDYESHLRNICRSFICWANLFANVSVEEVRYYVSYSRALLTLCQSLIIGLSCSYLQVDSEIEEESVFWLLVSMTTYILSSYFEANENALTVDVLTGDPQHHIGRKNNKITTSALRCNEMKGIKSDLLLLKLLIKELEPEVFSKFEELAIPLEEFFADHMINLFSTMFCPAMTYRIWDLIFFEGSASNQVRSHRTIVLTVFTALRNCKKLIIAAKTYREVKFILEFYTKFELNFDEFINAIQSNISEYLEKKLPGNETMLDQFNFIKATFFSKTKTLCIFDDQILDIEARLSKQHLVIYEQNRVIFGLVNVPYNFPEKCENTTLTYHTVSHMLKTFAQSYCVPVAKRDDPLKAIESKVKKGKRIPRAKLFAEEFLDERGLSRPRFTHIELIIHRMILYWPDIEKLTLRVSYDKQQQEKKRLTTLNISFFMEFEVENPEQLQRKILVELFENKASGSAKRIMWLEIDLKAVECNVLTKTILKFTEDKVDNYNENFTTAEAEISLLLLGSATGTEIPTTEFKRYILPELENEDHLIFSKMSFENVVKKIAGDDDMLFEAEPELELLYLDTKHSWKQHLAMGFEEFLEIMKKIAPFWTGVVDLAKIFYAVQRASVDQTFYFNDFMMLVILFCKFSFEQKMKLIFQLHACCNDIFKSRRSDEVSVSTAKGIAKFMYDAFMVYIPSNEIDNMIEDIVVGSHSVILHAVINPDSERSVNLPSSVFNRLINYMHQYHSTKDLYLADQEVLQYLKGVYVEMVRKSENPNQIALYDKNKLEINFTQSGLRHRFKLDFDKDWQIVPDPNDLAPNSLKIGSRMLFNYRYVIPLNPSDCFINEGEFLRVFEFLPMIDYLCAFENIQVPQPISDHTHIFFTVLIDYEVCCSIRALTESSGHEALNRSATSMISAKAGKANNFKKLLKDWMQVIVANEQSHDSLSQSQILASKPQLRSPLTGSLRKGSFKLLGEEDRSIHKDYEVIKLAIPQEKLSIYYSIRKLVSQVKKYIVKELYKRFTLKNDSKNVHPKLLSEGLLDLDFDVAVSANQCQPQEIKDLDQSVYRSLYEIEGAFDNGEISQIDVQINLKNYPIQPKPLPKAFDQLALYRFADGSTEWLPCRIVFNYRVANQRIEQSTNELDIDGYGIIFEKYPTETVLKQKNEVAIIHGIDLFELETKNIMAEQYTKIRAIKAEPTSSDHILRRVAKDVELARDFTHYEEEEVVHGATPSNRKGTKGSTVFFG